MTTLSEQAVLVTLDVDEIADHEEAISELEHKLCDCEPDNPAALEDEQKRLQRQVNNLKDEGIECNPRLTQVTRHGQLWLECDQNGWREHELSEEEPA